MTECTSPHTTTTTIMGGGGNCATTYHGAWWYNACHWANLNGEYGNTKFGEGVNWNSWNGVFYSMKEVRMMVRKS